MKRNILVFIMIIVVAGIVSAADTSEVGTGFSASGGTHIDSLESGGFAEIGFPLKKAPLEGGFELRNYISIFGFGNYDATKKSGTMLGQYKFTFGGFHSDLIVSRSYGLIGLGAGCGMTSDGVEFIWEMEFGGGAHIYLDRNYMLIVEMGGGGRSAYGDPLTVNGYGFIRAAIGGIW